MSTSASIFGEVKRFPWVTLSLVTLGGTRSVEFLVDTGLDGEVAVPWTFERLIGPPSESRTVLFANGQLETTGVADCQLTWGNHIVTVKAMYIKGETSLIGVELLRNHRLTVDMEDGGEVSIEEI
ncbi:MAG: aspartyl protease family protein [Capsulimonadaceae bacterium]